MTTSTEIVQKNSSDLDLKSLGTVFSQSGFFNDTKSASQAIVKILAGRELQIGPVSSMTGVYIVKGRISLSANLMLAVILRSGKYKHQVIKHTENECSLRFLRKDEFEKKWEEVGVSTFTMDDAKKAGLLNNPPWKSYPRNMLFARAVSNGARWYCPDVFCGHTPYTPDELDTSAQVNEEGDYTIKDVEVLEVIPASRAEKVKEFDRMMIQTNTELPKLLKHFEVSRFEDLTDELLDQAIRLLRTKLSRQR